MVFISSYPSSTANTSSTKEDNSPSITSAINQSAEKAAIDPLLSICGKWIWELYQTILISCTLLYVSKCPKLTAIHHAFLVPIKIKFPSLCKLYSVVFLQTTIMIKSAIEQFHANIAGFKPKPLWRLICSTIMILLLKVLKSGKKMCW